MELERVIAALAPRAVANPAPAQIADLAGRGRAPRGPGGGAAALVVERELAAAVPQLVVEDSRAAMAVAADVFFGHPTHELEVAGVTGTNGKTTTAFLLYAILAAAGRRPGLAPA